MNKDLDIITSRLALLFKPTSRTRYWLVIANDPYDQTYNVFFNSQRANERLRSIPLHKLANYNLNDLENLLKVLRQQTKLTIEFIGFTGQVWPQSQKIIQKRRETLE
ncbi:hypothetical protein A1D15_1152 [Lactiplantibacillus plantarum]|uniref:hypothetical protein n=1 Tax=Lactiplantibacillus plantarum TaxID=1590 RepID=UPI0007B55D5A|nr:hypothetical protein [Lactiplantibacillus plantarum]KZU95365.1 hypothetical protein A1D15_1152 [Lactiplantibacillus plantarum]